jgi:hypothetical protein
VKVMSEHGLKVVNGIEIITWYKNVINTNQYESGRLTLIEFEE